MSFQIFSLIGYASVLLWIVGLVLCVRHFMRRPRRWLCHAAVVVLLVALGFANINSDRHVNRIQVDQSEAMAAAQARQEKARRMAEEERAGEVAQIRFAEDDETDFLDMAGLDDADRKYMESMTNAAVPEWKQQKQTRSTERAADNSLEAQLDTTEKQEGMEGVVLEDVGKAPVVLPEKVVMLAHRLDGWNLKLIRWLVLAGLLAVVVDYLQRYNRVDEAYLPLPLPSLVPNGFTPLPGVCALPAAHARTAVEELEWLVRRGDTFVYLTANTVTAATIPETLYRLPLPHKYIPSRLAKRLPPGIAPLDVLHVQADDSLLDDTFVFEALWYNRAAFVIDSTDRAESFLQCLSGKLVERSQTRASVRQTVHIVWDLDVRMADVLPADVLRLAERAGFSLREIGRAAV